MKSYLQKLLLCILICFMLLSMAACQDPENSSPLEMENEYYRLDKENGKWYLEFKDEAKIPDVDDLEGYKGNFIKFDSVADFYERLLYTGLSKGALAYAKEYFWRDDSGRILMLDIEDLYTMVFPCDCTEFSSRKIEWKGANLKMIASCEHASYIMILPSEVLFNGKETGYEEMYSAMFDNTTRWDKRILLSEEKTAVRDATVYQWRYESSENVHWWVDYVLMRDGKKVYVHETYSDKAWQNENRQPSSVALCIEEGNVRYYCLVSRIQDRPTAEWLLSIGVTPFVPEEKSPAA